MANAIGVAPRRIYYWASGQRPVSPRYTLIIARLLAQTGIRRISTARSNYLEVINELDSAEARKLLASFDVGSLNLSAPPVYGRNELLSQAHLRVVKAEALVSRQQLTVIKLELSGQSGPALQARALLATFEGSLRLAREGVARM